MEKAAVIYWSGTGNTEIMAQEIFNGIKKAGIEADIFNVSNFSGDISEYSKIAFGCSAMGDEVLEEAEFEPFYESIEGKISGKKVALFGSYGWGDGKWLRDWVERARGKGAAVYGDGLMVNGTPDDEGKAQCVEFGEGFAKF